MTKEKTMKIKYENKQENWKLGDVVADGDRNLALITQRKDGNYCLMNIYPKEALGNYSLNSINNFSYGYPSLEDLQNAFKTSWHKVDATLVIKD